MKRDENQTVEYKESWNDKYLEWICGYANYGSEVHIDIYDDRLEVVSPGGMFDGGMPIQERGNPRAVGSSRRNPIVADIFNRLDFAERRGSGIGKILDAYDLPLANPCGRKPSFVSDTFFRTVLPNLTYGLTKEELVSFAETRSTPNSRTPNSRTPNSRTPNSQPQTVDRTSRPYKSTPQVNPTSRPHKSTPQVDPKQSTPNSRPQTVTPNSRTPNSRIPNSRHGIGRNLERVILALDHERGSSELVKILGIKNRTDLYMRFLLPAMQQGLIEYTIPNKPNSRLQKYRITAKGRKELQKGTAK